MNELRDQMNCSSDFLRVPPRVKDRPAPETGRRHFGRRPLYRSRKGMIFGVCKGLAEYAELPVFWIRVILIVLTVLSWILPFVILYTVAAFIMRPEPMLEPEAKADWKAYSAAACTQSMGLAQLRQELDELEYQTLRMERLVSARQFDWERRLNQDG